MSRIRILVRLAFALGVAAALAASALAQNVAWMGNTRLFPAFGGGTLPSRGASLEPNQSLTITTETWPNNANHRVFAVVTTNNWLSSQEIELNFDGVTGNNRKWYGIIGPYPRGSQVQFFLTARGSDNSVRFDNNNNQNFGFYSRFAPNFQNGAILQWFETDYVTMLRRLPEVVEAGYSAIYLPAPQKSGGGGFSVGYNPFDRFDFGDRLSMGTVRTKYGTTQQLWELINTAKRYGLEVYCDVVLNHNDNRASTAINRYPDMIPEDFHIRSSADTGNAEVNFNTAQPFDANMLTGDLVGLVDISLGDGNPTQTGPFNLPSFASWNTFGKPTFVRHPRTPQYYPNGQPQSEDVRQYLKRWGWFLTSVFGFDGYRFDAVKHIPPAFFDQQFDQPGGVSSNGDFIPHLFNLNPNLYLFGEDFTTNAYELREYAKAGMNLLDFPLKFVQDDVLNSQGFDHLGNAFSNGYGIDPNTGLAYEMGGLARANSVGFVHSHDQGPPQSNNLAHALVLTRPARPKVYFDGNNIEPNNWSNFPKPGRYDALGSGDNIVPKLVDARNRFGRGFIVNRWVSQNLFVYERVNGSRGMMLVGLNSRGDFQSITQNVQTAFAPGTVLEDLSGQQPNVTVGGNQSVTITVPSNSAGQNSNNARGFVIYVPVTPKPVSGVEPIRLFADGVEAAPETVATPAGAFASPRSFKRTTVSGNTLRIRVQTDASGASALVKINRGMPLAGLAPLTNTAEGLADGFVPMASLGNGVFELDNVSLGALPTGQHLLRVRVFRNTGADPGLYRDFVAWVQVNKATERVIDGDLADAGSALVFQTRSASNPANRLDGLFVTNDDRNIYLGLAGNVDTAENSTFGIAAFLDVAPGGITELSALNDDSGPAPRLLSNHQVRFGSRGFEADFALGVLRRSQLGSSPESPNVGDPIAPYPIGAFAGLYRINPWNLNWLNGVPSAIAWKPRNGPFDPPAGLEARIPVESLWPDGKIPARFSVLAFLTNTGESGTTLTSTNPQRGITGGYALGAGSTRNQFLPPQPGIVSDPFTAPATATNFTRVQIRFSQADPNLSIQSLSTSFNAGTQLYRQRVRITNQGSSTIQGPFWVLAVTDSDAELLSNRGRSRFNPKYQYIRLSTPSLAPGASVEVDLDYRGVPAGSPAPELMVRVGMGIV